jgi:hypothetical protein
MSLEYVLLRNQPPLLEDDLLPEIAGNGIWIEPEPGMQLLRESQLSKSFQMYRPDL